MSLDNFLDQDLDDELRRHLLAYGQRFDIQTGLLNYQSFLEQLTTRLKAAQAGEEIAILWIDILNLRREFALWGWNRAQALVNDVVEQLRSLVDKDTLLGRFSRRSLLVALKISKADKANWLRVQEIIDSLLSVRTYGSQTNLQIAAGVAFSPCDSETAEDLVRFASLAATRASTVKASTVVSFHADMSHDILRDHLLEVEMRRGLAEGQFAVQYQPKVDLSTGHILGAEALIRWHHPAWGVVMPSEFVPLAERSDLIHRILDFMLCHALHDLQRWNRAGIALPLVAVNMSWANLRRNGFAEYVRAILNEIPITPSVLELEVTESVLFDDEPLFTARLHQLKEIGVHVAIDDFGTRYTGFNMLKQLPLDSMKIDRCFIHGIDRSRDMQALCSTIIAMARQLKLRTVAEGVENIEELEMLQHIGCDAAQGYLFQQPLAAEEFIEFLRVWPLRMGCFGFPSDRQPA